MGWTEIVLLLIQNAPSAIKTVEDGIEWAQKTWGDVKAANAKPADQITKEELLAHLRQISQSSSIIQNL